MSGNGTAASSIYAIFDYATKTNETIDIIFTHLPFLLIFGLIERHSKCRLPDPCLSLSVIAHCHYLYTLEGFLLRHKHS